MPPSNSPDKFCLTLRPSSLLAACFLATAAVVLAYLGGVMMGRSQCPAPAVSEEAPPAAESPSVADGGAAGPDTDGGKVLAPEELHFSRLLRNASVPRPAAPAPAAAPPSAAPALPAAPAPAGPPAQAQSGQGLYDYVFQMGAFKDEASVDALRQRLEGRDLRTRMERSGKLYVVLVLLRGDEARAAEVHAVARSLGLGMPLQRSRKPVARP